MKNQICLLIVFTMTTVISVESVVAQSYYSRRRGQSNQQYNNPRTNTNMRSWSQGMVTDRDHDFGVVARASKQEHVFQFKNTTGAELILTGVRTSCGCTKPTILTSRVKPGELAKVNARFDTLNFYGNRSATLTVSVQKTGQRTEFGEIQLSVKGNIRRDVVLNPGEFNFNQVDSGNEAKRTATIQYAGSPQWKILAVKSTNPNVTAEMREISRDANNGRVSYELTVKLASDQPVGTFSEFLTIVTNDARTSGMPVKVKGNVKALIEVSPIRLGAISKGQTVKKKLILHSATAISISDIKTNDSRIKFEVAEGEKTLHILTYTLDTSNVGQINQEITIVSKGPEMRETKVPFSVQIVPATVVSNGK